MVTAREYSPRQAAYNRCRKRIKKIVAERAQLVMQLKEIEKNLGIELRKLDTHKQYFGHK